MRSLVWIVIALKYSINLKDSIVSVLRVKVLSRNLLIHLTQPHFKYFTPRKRVERGVPCFLKLYKIN